MFTIVNRLRVLLVLMVLAVATNPALATPRATHHGTTERLTAQEAAMEPTPNGSPELGILLIIGIVAVVIFVAWLFSRMGDSDSATGSDVPA